jgi:hypothetical protein
MYEGEPIFSIWVSGVGFYAGEIPCPLLSVGSNDII